MAGSVLNSSSVFQLKFSAKLKLSASKSATSPSCKTSGCEKTLFFPKDVVFDASILQFKAH
jgi:hypothetical protein